MILCKTLRCFFKRRYFKYVLITHKGSKFALGGWGKVIWPEVYNKYCISIIIRCPFQAFTHRIKVSIVIPQNRKKAPRSLRSKSYALFYHRSKRLRIVDSQIRFKIRTPDIDEANLEHKTLDSSINQWTVSIIPEFHVLAKIPFL